MAIQADHHSVSPQDMQDHTVKYIKSRHHSADTPTLKEASPSEPGVTTQKMKHNGTVESEAQYVKEEVGGPLRKAGGTVVETVEHKEDVVTRQRVL